MRTSYWRFFLYFLFFELKVIYFYLFNYYLVNALTFLFFFWFVVFFSNKAHKLFFFKLCYVSNVFTVQNVWSNLLFDFEQKWRFTNYLCVNGSAKTLNELLDSKRNKDDMRLNCTWGNVDWFITNTKKHLMQCSKGFYTSLKSAQFQSDPIVGDIGNLSYEFTCSLRKFISIAFLHWTLRLWTISLPIWDLWEIPLKIRDFREIWRMNPSCNVLRHHISKNLYLNKAFLKRLAIYAQFIPLSVQNQLVALNGVQSGIVSHYSNSNYLQ